MMQIRLRFIEVKGRFKGASNLSVSRNEILTGLNKPENYFLAIVLLDGDNVDGLYYVERPFGQVPEFGVIAVNYNLQDLIRRSVSPRRSASDKT